MSTSLLDQYRYRISDIKLNFPLTARWCLRKSIFLLKIAKTDTGGNNELPMDLVHPVEGRFVKNQIVWSEQTLYDVTAESTITAVCIICNFKILMKKGKKDESAKTIKDYAETMSGLLDIQNSSRICKVPPNQRSQLSFTVKKDRFKDMLYKAKQQSEGIDFAPGVSCSTFLTYFGIIKTAVDPIAALNPYAQQIWGIVSMVPNILQTHINRNSNVKELLQQLMDIYTYINEADRLPILIKDARGIKLRNLIYTTCECADVMKKYAENNTAENLIKGPIFDDKISEFKRSFDRIFKAIGDSLLLGTAIVTSNIENVQFLDDMPYAKNVGIDSRKKCLEGTRETMIKEIREWLDTDTSARVLILSGQAGTGKSSVAHTLAETLNERLGSFFCFNRSDKGNVNLLFSTISRNLADRDDLWRRNLVQAIKSDITIRASYDPKRQFKEMIINPSIGTTKRMVIIIDALDESGDKTEREILLNLLFERSSELPRNYRIIITSRPEDDIAQFHQHSNVFCKYMADVHPDDTLNDIQQFIRDKLSAVAKILDVVDKNWHLLLAKKAQSLFQWAKIACVYILELEELEAAQRLRTVLSKPTSSLYEMLWFNICGLETSHLRNRDVPNFDSRVAEAIPSYLSYACCFWTYHLEFSSLNSDILEKINDLMRNKLLYFFEVLSLLGEVDHGCSGMQILKYKTKDENSELAARAAEASQFALEFGAMMMESTPHLYLSSLPYISNHSFISQQFLPQYPQLLSMDFGKPIVLQPEIKDGIWQKHPSTYPRTVAFSPQGRQIACGFNNGDLWVWDYVTGVIVTKVGPEGEQSAVCKVVFSLNGEQVYCCFRDGSILTWEAKTNKVLYESNEGLAPGECDDCTISPDGRYIAFRHGQTLSFYERETCSKLFEDSSGHSENRPKMMFSPSGSLFGFQSGDMVVRLWNTRRQAFIPPFVSITEKWLLDVLDDNYVIAWVGGHEVWDIRTRTMVLQFKWTQWSSDPGQTPFSTNGEYVLYSEGNERWIWNMSTGEVTQRFVGRPKNDYPCLPALSPDSKYIAFETDNSIHVLAWDALVQEETEDSSEDIEEQKAITYTYRNRAEAWLGGQRLLSKVQGSGYTRGDIQVFDTTGMTGLKLDFQVDFSNWPLVEVSPEDNHWSMAYADMSRADLLCLWNIDEKKEFILDRSDGEVTALAFSATGDRLISSDSKGNIKVWDVRTHQLISRGGSSGAVTALAFSPVGTTFWVAYKTGRDEDEDEDEGEDGGKDGGEDKDEDKDEDGYEAALNRLNIEERECSKSQNITNRFSMRGSTNCSVFLFSNNTYLCVCAVNIYAIGFYSCDLLVLDCSTGASINRFNTRQFPKFSFNRRYVAWIDEKDLKKVELWDLEEEGIVLEGFPSDGEVVAFGFFNDSTRICILGGVHEQQVDIWDIKTKGLVRQLFFGDFHFRDTIALFEDSLLWVGTPDRGRIWDLHVHEIITRLYDDNLDNSQSSMLPDRHLQTERLIDDYKSHSENTAVLDYALMAWNKARFSPRTKSEDGWMLGPRGELLFWVPDRMRKGLLYPSVSSTTHQKLTKLNFDKFVHGTRWTECGKQPKP